MFTDATKFTDATISRDARNIVFKGQTPVRLRAFPDALGKIPRAIQGIFLYRTNRSECIVDLRPVERAALSEMGR
jgi:hypothetical protein